MMKCSITQLEKEAWTKEWSKDINPVEPDGYDILKLSQTLALISVGPEYSGWLAKNVQPVVPIMTNFTFRYSLRVDQTMLLCAQVSESDFKTTDDDGYTYDGSGQWEQTPDGWKYYINNPWISTGIVIPTPQVGDILTTEVSATRDIVAKNLIFKGLVVNGVPKYIPSTVATIPAKQVGWEKNQLVTQLQQCINGSYGGYVSEYFGIGYDLSNGAS